ncbi:MAG: hypothetical protein SPK03_06175 [Alloprevotella sp.]|nr:hypothetical protein [Alloprevotella sp.]
MQSGLTQGFTLGYGLKVSPSGLRVERMAQAGYDMRLAGNGMGLRVERMASAPNPGRCFPTHFL